jgi:hypothetical protein
MGTSLGGFFACGQRQAGVLLPVSQPHVVAIKLEEIAMNAHDAE